MRYFLICISFVVSSALSSIALFPVSSVSAANSQSCSLKQAQLDILVANGFNPDQPFVIVYDYSGSGEVQVFSDASYINFYFERSILAENASIFRFTYTMPDDVRIWSSTPTLKKIDDGFLNARLGENVTAVCTSPVSANGIIYQEASTWYSDQFAVVYPLPPPPPADVPITSTWLESKLQDYTVLVLSFTLTMFVSWQIIKSFRFGKYE